MRKENAGRVLKDPLLGSLTKQTNCDIVTWPDWTDCTPGNAFPAPSSLPSMRFK